MTLTEILSLSEGHKEIVLENLLDKYRIAFRYDFQSGVWVLTNESGVTLLEGTASSREIAVSSLLAKYLVGAKPSPRVEGSVGYREVPLPVERSPLPPDLDPKEIYDAIRHLLPQEH